METNRNSLYNSPQVYDLHCSPKKSKMIGDHYGVLFAEKDIKTIHDCSYGTGNLTDELARRGYILSGSDISESMLEKAREKNEKEGLNIQLIQSDFRELSTNIRGEFDCVMSTGNSLAHVPNNDVEKALEEMSKLVKDGGYLYLDTRNWDRILETHQRFFYYQPEFKNDERINTIHVWDHNQDGSITFNMLYSFEKDNRIYRTEEFQETYYPLRKDVIVNKLKELGFKDFEIWNLVLHQVKDFKEMEWYCLICKKGD